MTETWLPSTDGIITRLTATLRELVRSGHQVLVIAPQGPAGDEGVELPGVSVRTVPSAGVRWLYGGQRWGLPSPRVGRFLREFRPDVVHVANPACLGIAGVLAATRQNLPLVASYHTDLTEHVPHYRLGGLVPVIWWLLRQLHGRAAVNLATSRAAIDNLEAHGIADVQLWPRGVDLGLFRPLVPPRAEPQRRPVALYVGRLAGEKGLSGLAPLAAADSGFDLVIVGDGPQCAELTARLSSPSVRFRGIVRGAALADAYRDADLFVFPSTTETLGLVLLEALASGLPVVAADSPASREVLADCAVARLYPSDEPAQLLTLARDIMALPVDQRSRAEAVATAQHWTWEGATATLLTFYTAAVSRATADPVRGRQEPGQASLRGWSREVTTPPNRP